ncbi:MAG: sulfatase-like hydrolase/transferase [Bacillota bacterium]|nr:sulfatase-like hydrolase/transferase [Bacillota bacterium]
MTERQSNKSIIKDIFILSIIIYYMELILRLNTKASFFNFGLFYSLILAVAAAAFVCFISSFFKKKRKIVLIILIIFLTYLYASQLVYFDIFKTYYSVYSAVKAVKAIGFLNDLIYKIFVNLHWVILISTPSITYSWKIKKNYKEYNIKWTNKLISALIPIAIVFLINYGLDVEGDLNKSSTSISTQLAEPIMSVNKLGLVSTMTLDLYFNAFGFEEEEEVPEFAEVEEILLDSLEEEVRHNYNTDISNQIKYNKIKIDFDELINRENDEIIKNMHQYFKTLEPSEKNKYTGKFKGYNLILITAESFHKVAIDKKLTPTLYKMQQEGYNFTNFYNPLWGVSTLDGEYVATTGLLPKSGVWSMYESRDNYLPYTMGNILRKEGYETRAYHNHYYTYYDRHLSHPNLGYEYIGLGNGLDVEETWPESDLEMMELTADEYMDKEPFHTYYLTISGHMRYTFSGNYIARKNRELVEHLPFSEEGKGYMATQIELDRAMEYLLEKLEEYGVAKNTLIVMSPDHYPYGMKKENLDELAGHELENNFEIYKSSLIIYSEGMKSETIDKPVSSLDIIPTVMNLMGLEYDSRFLMGRDIFSDSTPLIIFHNRSFITDKGRYNSVTEEFIPNEGVKIEEGYVENVLQEIERKFYYGEQILDKDYYSKVFNK